MNAWQNVMGAPMEGREGKPRRIGVTMVIDKGLGLRATRDLMQIAALHIDFVKFGFGTAWVYPERILEAKVEQIRNAGVHVYPGGTLLEVAVHQGRTEAFFQTARAIGFTYVEVSEGTIELCPSLRQHLIERAQTHGLRVISEVGKKDKNARLQVEQVHRQVALDLAAGSDYIIVEGRDSGTVGVFYPDGSINDDLVQAITNDQPWLDRLIWEAPRVTQQQQLILRLGSNVNLGNVQPEDVISLEATRVGLRGDTLRYALSPPLVQRPGTF